MNKKTKLMKQCDRLWFAKLFKPICESCGLPAKQVHHFFYKGSYGHLRYDLDNGISICQSCHYRIHFKDGKVIVDTIIKKRGDKWYKSLKAKALNRPQGSWATVKYYQIKIKELSL